MLFQRAVLRTAVCVDGFDLYYGALKGTPWKWLDLPALFGSVLRSHPGIRKVRYLAARVPGTPADQSKPQRQDIYLPALRRFRPEGEVYRGHVLRRPVRVPLAYPVGNASTASAARGIELHDSNTVFRRRSSAGTALSTCFGAVLRATSGDPVGPWASWSPVLVTVRLGRGRADRWRRQARVAAPFGAASAVSSLPHYESPRSKRTVTRPPRPPTAPPGEDWRLQRGTLHATIAQCGSSTRDSALWPSRIAGGNCRATWCRS